MSDSKKLVLIAVVAAVVAICAQLAGFPFGGPPPAAAHLSGNCSHSTQYWQVWSYGILIYYRQVNYDTYQSGNGDHVHKYRTDATQTNRTPFKAVDFHNRVCNGWV